MTTFQLPNLSTNPKIRLAYIINNKQYTFSFQWLENFCLLSIYIIKDNKKLSPNDFATNEINNKINDLLTKSKDSFITFEDFKIIQKGNYVSKGQKVPYIKFSAKVKNIPFKNVIGIIAAYETKNEKAKNPSTKLIFTVVDTKAFNPVIVENFIKAVKFWQECLWF